MRRLVLAACLLLAACTGSYDSDTTTTSTWVTLPPVTTTIPQVDVQLEDCDQPPVTFSALCESFELLEEWYVDRPVDRVRLVGLARDALVQDLSDLAPTEAPRTLFCAVPDPTFAPFCEALADLVEERPVDVQALMDRVVGTVIEDAYGPFTYYLAPDQVTTIRDNGVVGGIGVLLDATDPAGSKCARLGPTCPLRIVFTLDDNPGKAAGLQADDVVLEVDGISVDGQGFAATAARIAGDETGEVNLTIDRDGERLEFTIVRARLHVPTVTGGIVQDGVAYLRIPDFEGDVPGLVFDALSSIEGDWSTMVLDLRDNPGGLVSAVVEVASEFISDGPVFLEDEGLGDPFPVESLGPGGLATSGRIIVLVNGGTASAAEILTGALRDRRDAVVIGTPTFGKDAVQIPFDMRNGGRLAVVVARWLTPEGASVGNGGLRPDVELELTHEMTETQLVEAALEAAR
ncbi:MAG TPA: S41 family peptidase [Acidimicrobiia bacterium]